MASSNFGLNSGIRDMSPCNGCTEKFTACHGDCPKDKRGAFGYSAWLAKLREVEAKRKAYNNLNRRKKWRK